MASLSELAAEVYDEIGLTAPTTIMGNQEPEAVQLRRFLEATGLELIRRHSWQVLKREVTFVTVAGDRQINLRSQIPGFDRIVPNTMFNRTTQRQLLGPMSPTRYQIHQMTPVNFNREFRIRGSYIYVVGNEGAGHTIAFEYVTKNWIVSADATERSRFAADTDENILDDRALVLGAKWRALRQAGLEYRSAELEYQRYVSQLIAHENPHGTLDLTAAGRGMPSSDIGDGVLGGDFVIPDPDSGGAVAFEDDLVWQPPGSPDVDGYNIDWS